MKRLVFIISTFILFFSSCRVDKIQSIEDKPELGITFKVTEVTDPVVVDKIQSYRKEKLNALLLDENSKLKSLQFDYENLSYVVMDGQKTGAIVANQQDVLADSKTKYAMGFFMHENEVIGSMLTKTTLVDDSALKIFYYKFNGELIREITIDSETRSIILHNTSAKIGPTDRIIADCGHDSAECIDTMYTDLGWGSVSWWIGTALFSPGWVLGTVAGCVYVACIQ